MHTRQDTRGAEVAGRSRALAPLAHRIPPPHTVVSRCHAKAIAQGIQPPCLVPAELPPLDPLLYYPSVLTLLASSSRPLEPAPLCCSPSASLYVCLLPQSAALPLCPCAPLGPSLPLCPSLPPSATRSHSLRPCRSHLAHAVMGGAGISQRASLERAWK